MSQQQQVEETRLEGWVRLLEEEHGQGPELQESNAIFIWVRS